MLKNEEQMIITTVETKNINTSKYLFNQLTTWDFQNPYCRLLEKSFKKNKILSPLLITEKNNTFYLIDGFSRLAYARYAQIITLPCIIKQIDDESAAELILQEKSEQISGNAAVKIRFVSFLKRLEIKDEIIINNFLPKLNMEPHEKIYRRMEKTALLPEEVLNFCQEKNFSFKQCYNLTRYSVKLLVEIFKWKKDLAFTASTLDSILDDLKDYLKFNDMTVEQFLKTADVKNIFNAKELNMHQKTKALRDIIKRLRFPILSEANSRIKHIIAKTDLPDSMFITWDPILENEYIQITLKFNSTDQFKKLKDFLKQEKVTEAVRAILKEL
jgi:hypothetical protein